MFTNWWINNYISNYLTKSSATFLYNRKIQKLFSDLFSKPVFSLENIAICQFFFYPYIHFLHLYIVHNFKMFATFKRIICKLMLIVNYGQQMYYPPLQKKNVAKPGYSISLSLYPSDLPVRTTILMRSYNMTSPIVNFVSFVLLQSWVVFLVIDTS